MVDFAAADGAALTPDNRNFAMVMSGSRLFQQYCAACHGQRAEGGLNVRSQAAGGQSSPPALDGSAHSWHHPTRDLLAMISRGTMASGGGMPAWGGTLSEQQMVEIISWIQSKWPEEKYRKWYRTNEGASQ